jgi:hypothetical protein
MNAIKASDIDISRKLASIFRFDNISRTLLLCVSGTRLLLLEANDPIRKALLLVAQTLYASGSDAFFSLKISTLNLLNLNAIYTL